MIQKILYAIIIALLCCKNVKGQVTPAWATTYVANYPNSLFQKDMATDKTGNVYITGYTSDTSYNNTNVVTLKYNSMGQLQWIQQYDSINYYTKIAVDDMGNAYVLGLSKNSNLLTIKYNTQGVLQWSKSYISNPNYCWPSDIVTDDSGNVYITGTAHNNNFTTIKYNTSGVLIWDAIDVQSNGQNNGFISLDNHKNVYITTRGSDSTQALTANIIKYNNSGIKQWESVYAGNFNPGLCGAADLKFDPKGFVYLLASTTNDNNGEGDYAVAKYDTLGNEIWTFSYSFTSYYDLPQSMALDKAGNVYVTGSIYPSGGTVDSIATIKIDQSGTFKWKKMYSSGYDNYDVASGIVIDSLGYLYVGGVSSDNANKENFITIKYDSLGNEIWIGRYKNTSFSSDYSNSISLDKFGNIYVCGTTYDINTKGILTIKYSNNVGIQEFSNLTGLLSIFPNPTSSALTITDEQNQFQNSSIQIKNTLGQTVLSIPFQKEMDVSQLSNGIYFLQIKTEDKRLMNAKFIKE